jgi:hypothetical protein
MRPDVDQIYPWQTFLDPQMNLLIRIPIRNTTNGSSISAVYLPGITLAMRSNSFHEYMKCHLTLLLYMLNIIGNGALSSKEHFE